MMRCSTVAFAVKLGYWLSAAVALARAGPDVLLEDSRHSPELPDFLQGKAASLQEHTYSPDAISSLHTAFGLGLQEATTGVPASFTINLVGEDGERIQEQWSQGTTLFMYVWIANEDQIFIAEVEDNGDGTLTATYESSFPGDYLIYIEEVAVERKDEGRPIVGSPFSLTISGEPSIDVDNLPVCSSKETPTDSFWRPGSWISSNVASSLHGVSRTGWVFQPKTCALEAFSYEDLMALANSEEETWLLVLGDSVFRGVFLTLVDMVLAKGQKDNLLKSIIQKCWGYADIRLGNLRVTYQDARLYTVSGGADSIVCNDEKLSSGGQAEYIRSFKELMAGTVFGDDSTSWPSVIIAPSYLVSSATTVDVPLGALPASWKGRIVFLEHMDAFGQFHWRQDNPTMTRLEDVGMSYHHGATPSDVHLRKMDRYQELDSRVSFMSLFPMMQGQLFQNEQTQEFRKYGASQHYHYVRWFPDDLSYGGAKMVISTITEMLANMMIGEAVGSKADIHQLGDATTRIGTDKPEFEMCTDCPHGLIPFHIKSPPNKTCVTITSLPRSEGPPGEAWDGSLCPEWCMKTEPVSVIPTQSGPVQERKCNTKH